MLKIRMGSQKIKFNSSVKVLAKPHHQLKKINISIGIPSFNEEKDIAQVVKAIQRQVLKPGTEISEIIVIDGNSTDQTRQIVRSIMKMDKRIRLLVQSQRKGKIDAINMFLSSAREEILIMANSDNIPDKNCLQRVINPLADKKVGLVGPQMICINSGDDFFPYLNRLIWRLHHKISLENPKMSSFVAFRKKEIKKIPLSAIIDEPAMEAIIQEQNLKIVYCPEAKAYLKGAETLKDFIRQRRRNHVGYLNIKKIFPHYYPSTFRAKLLTKMLFEEISFDLVDNFFLISSVILEIYCKIMALYDFYLKKKNYKAWPMIKTSKGLKLHQHGKTT